MLKKIILPVVLLIFTQQNFYGMQVEQEGVNENNDIKKQRDFWEKVHKYMNGNNLSYLWGFLITFHSNMVVQRRYGNMGKRIMD